MAIYLIRHGETAANAARVLQKPDVPLSERGLGQARRLAQRLATAGIAGILASDLRRAAMTAEQVQVAAGVPLVFDALLHERSFGDLRGSPYADLDQDPFALDYEPPGGESWPRFHARVDAAVARIAKHAAEIQGDLAVVTHGLVCRSLVERHALLAEGVPSPGFGWTNTSVTILDGARPWSIRVLNCSAHLDDPEKTGAA